MKVKVNGAWVDVPAFKVKVGDVACLEGDITLTSATYYFRVTHNLGKKAIFATCEHSIPTTERWVNIGAFLFDGGIGGGLCYNNSDAIGNDGSTVQVDVYGETSTWCPHNFENWLQFYCNSNQKFRVGTYHYKIYYAI